jgi:hypothetical protein
MTVSRLLTLTLLFTSLFIGNSMLSDAKNQSINLTNKVGTPLEATLTMYCADGAVGHTEKLKMAPYETAVANPLAWWFDQKLTKEQQITRNRCFFPHLPRSDSSFKQTPSTVAITVRGDVCLEFNCSSNGCTFSKCHPDKATIINSGLTGSYIARSNQGKLIIEGVA